ncbi:MAG: hypothetical protein ABI886_14330 [Betaproteobacteria bacterium]
MQTTAARSRILALAGVVAALWLAASSAFAADAASTAAASPPVVTAAATAPAAPAVQASPPVTPKAGTPAKVTYTDAKCTKFVLSGTAPNQKLTCQ